MKLQRDERGKHPFEDEGLRIVEAIKRDYASDLTDDDGGQILSWLTSFADQVAASIAGSCVLSKPDAYGNRD